MLKYPLRVSFFAFLAIIVMAFVLLIMLAPGQTMTVGSAAAALPATFGLSLAFVLVLTSLLFVVSLRPMAGYGRPGDGSDVITGNQLTIERTFAAGDPPRGLLSATSGRLAAFALMLQSAATGHRLLPDSALT